MHTTLNTLGAAAMAATLTILPATASLADGSAQAITLDRPMMAQSIHTTEADVVVYFLEVSAGYEVTASYASRANPNEPGQLKMLFTDGDRVTFNLPDLPLTTYSFARSGDAVSITATPAPIGAVASTR